MDRVGFNPDSTLYKLCSSSLLDNNHWQIGHYVYKVWDT